MGCDYYIIHSLVIEYNDYEKKYITIKEERGYVGGDETIEESMNRRYYSEIIYENGNWIFSNDELEDLYNYILENNDVSLYYVNTITKVISCYRR
jgi:hypothetical protein